MAGTVLICDEPDCLANVRGDGDKFGGGTMRKASDAGWLVAKRDPCNLEQIGPDLCPEHRRARGL